MALIGSNEPGHKQIYSRQLTELNLKLFDGRFRSIISIERVKRDIIIVLKFQKHDTQSLLSTNLINYLLICRNSIRKIIILTMKKFLYFLRKTNCNIKSMLGPHKLNSFETILNIFKDT